MTGSYLLLVMVLLAARIPSLERLLGQDRLLRAHRRMSAVPLLLLLAHAVLTTLGDAEAGHLGYWAEGRSLITTTAWILAAVVSYVLLIGIAGLSIRAARRRISYDAWWVLHLYTYLALALSLPHQIVDGVDFVGHPLIQAVWLTFWAATAGAVVIFRIGLPVARSAYHRLRVVAIREETEGVISVLLRGRHLDRLPAAGGQYLGWRFLTPTLWWHAHPFSLSALPAPPYLRITVKVTGDATQEIAGLRLGTRVAFEGPYGTFTADRRTRTKVALIGAGIGITPIRALLEELPEEADVVVVQRASTRAGLIHADEIAELVEARRGRYVWLPGARNHIRLFGRGQLVRMIPDLADRDVYVCGPDAFCATVLAAARRLGVPDDALHHESFAL